jgi:hypothetical protein
VRKILLARPDVFVPLHAVVMFFVGALVGVGTAASVLAGLGSRCGSMPYFAASAASCAPLFWSLRHARGVPGRRAAVVLIAFSIVAAVASFACALRTR